MWAVSPLFAEWLAAPSNLLFQHGVLSARSIVLELGCGIAGIVGLATVSKVKRYILTDQDYVLKLLKKNIEENSSEQGHSSHRTRNKASHPRQAVKQAPELMVLDWEQSSLDNLAQVLAIEKTRDQDDHFSGVDCVVACDCIFNEALIEPFVETCAALCDIRRRHSGSSTAVTVCVIAQQLRSPEVFGQWQAIMTQKFRLWRMASELNATSGFVVHLCVLRD